MDSSSQRRSKTNLEADIISSLPDSLLLKILSFLSFDSAVRTSLLSKRWRPLCLSLTTLHFSDHRRRKKNLRGADFIDFVNRFLMGRPAGLKIEEFGLQCFGIYDHSRVQQWIYKALDYQVERINLKYYAQSIQLFPIIYTYGSLEVLRLDSRILVDVPNDVNFWRLKVLELQHITISSYESVEKLLRSCPMLEDLIINGCKWLGGSCLNICGSKLKYLKLKCEYDVDRENKLKVLIDTPALENLNIRDTIYAEISIKDTLLSLRKARIDVGFAVLYELNTSVFQILEKICNVQCLTLTDKVVGALDGASNYDMPTFPNLLNLEIRVENWSCWDLLAQILASSPNLECLSLPYGVDLINTSQKCCYGLWRSPILDPECLVAHLKTIEIGMFHGTDDELSLVEYFLCCGSALKKISIAFSDVPRKRRIRKEILSYEKESATCKIDIEI